MAKEWERYEHKIFEKFEKESPGCTVIKNYKLKGRTTSEMRQIDILVLGQAGKIPFKIAVECKCFARKVDVKGVEAFIGMLGDLDVDKGVMITTMGFSNAAKLRAASARIAIDIVEFENWDEYDVVDFECCVICEPGEDEMPGTVGTTDGNRKRKGKRTLYWSYCTRCNSVNVYCAECGCHTGVDDVLYGDKIECDGGCGMIFIVHSEHDGDGLFSESVEIKS